MKESHKKTISTTLIGLVKLIKIVWIVIKSFFEAITYDFYKNIKKYWKGTPKKNNIEEPKKDNQTTEPKQPLP